VEENHKGKPRKDKIENLVEHLHMDPKLAEESMRRAIDVMEMHNTVDGREERAVQPPPAL